MADGYFGLRILDVTNPANPNVLGSFNPDGDTWSVQIVSNKTYLACRGAGLQILDTTQPANVQWLGGISTPGFGAAEVQVRGSLAYVADGASGLEIYNVSNPANIISGAFLNQPNLRS